jgi:two-component system LytT family response regulator
MLTAVIVDDEIAAIKSIELIANKYCNEVNVIGSAQTAGEGVNLILKTNPDLVFLDVEMPMGSGFDLLEAIPDRKFEVIFITAYNHYAVKAFKYSAVDYLLKPISIEEFIDAVGKVQMIKSNSIDTRSKYLSLFENLNNLLPNKLIITHEKGFDHVDLDKLLYLEKDGGSTIVYEVGGGTTISVRSFKEYEDILFDRNFFKLNPTIMVNLLHVAHVNKSTKSITLSGGVTIPVVADKLSMLVSSVERLWNV